MDRRDFLKLLGVAGLYAVAPFQMAAQYVVYCGDSSLAGDSVLASALDARLLNVTDRINVARGGSLTSDLERQMLLALSLLPAVHSERTLVILASGGNDIRKGLGLSALIKNIQHFLNHWRESASNVRFAVLTCPDQWAGTNPDTCKRRAKAHRAFLKRFTTDDVCLVDVYEFCWLHGINSGQSWFAEDQIHLNEQGNLAVADYMYQRLLHDGAI